MRYEAEFKLRRIWYEGRPPPAGLRAMEGVYRLANRVDRWWKLRARPADLEAACIVVVGNITVGGSGKTPLVVRLCELLQESGLRTGVISRGYGRKTSGPRLVSAGAHPDQVGDEPLLIAGRAGVPVIVARDRCEAARRLLSMEVDVIVADDGLQHYRLPRDLEVCVIDGSRGFGNGRLLPAGPLREPLERLATVDHVIVNGDGEALPGGIGAERMTLVAGLLRSLDSGQSWRLSQFAGCSVNAVAGIGNPMRFFGLLRQAGIKPIEHAFADHHRFTAGDFEAMDPELPILMTEKDAVKCRSLGLKNSWFLTVDAVLASSWETGFVEQVNSRLHSKSKE